MSQLIVLNLPPNFNRAACMNYLQRSSDEILHQFIEGRLRKLLPFPNDPVLLELDFQPETLVIKTLNRPLSKEESQYIRAYINEWFDLGRDLEPFYQLAAKDALLGPIVPALKGLRLVGVPDLMEALCWSVIGQQVNLAFAYTLKRRLVEQYGKSMHWDGRDYWVFPEASRLAECQISELHALSLTQKKSAYLIELSKEIATGLLSKVQLRPLGLDAAEKRLCQLYGIGPWSANYVLMRCLRFEDAFPAGDAGLQNAVRKQLNWDRKPTVSELHEMAKRWMGWRSYATFYLWQSLK